MSADAAARVTGPALLVLLALVVAACGGDMQGRMDMGMGEQGEDLPASGDAARGEELFVANCAACHGVQGQGTDSGPPLVHEIYEPSHHPDESFLRAVQQGVQPHHWEFGPMPGVPGLDADDVADIVAHVRSMQREAGIE